ncbi:MAG: hypothetical protein R6U51_12720 [Anaerolineales bacterium]
MVWEDAYRKKNGEGHQGYVADVTKNRDSENEPQMITNLQVEPDTTDDMACWKRRSWTLWKIPGSKGSMWMGVIAVLPRLQIYSSTAWTSPRGPSARENFPQKNYIYQTSCWSKFTGPHIPGNGMGRGRNIGRYLAYIEDSLCVKSPLQEPRPAEKLRGKTQRVLEFFGKLGQLIRWRRNSERMRESGQNLQVKDKQKAQRAEHHAGNQVTNEVVYLNRKQKDGSGDFGLSLFSLLSVFNFGREPRLAFNIVKMGVFQEIRV